MSEIRVYRTSTSDVYSLREKYRSVAWCQIVRDSILPRGLADPYLLEVEGEKAGYAGVWNRYHRHRIMEFFALPEFLAMAPELLRVLAEHTGARELEVQTNVLAGRGLLERCSSSLWTEKLLFEEGSETELTSPGLVFRERNEDDHGPDGPWVVDDEGKLRGAGGWLTHYNPPYADLYLEVIESARGQGVGSYLVQELRRACSRAGHGVAARCNPDNQASRKALERGAMVQCGEILVGVLSWSQVAVKHRQDEARRRDAGRRAAEPVGGGGEHLKP
jgi:GNAT superfamily N-acetyltransferase